MEKLYHLRIATLASFLISLNQVVFASETTFITSSSFLAANPFISTDNLSALDSYVLTFGNVKSGPISSSNFSGLLSGVTYTAGSGYFFIDTPNWMSLSNSTIRILDDNPGGYMTLVFRSPTKAVGFNLSSLFLSSNAVIRLYNGNSLLSTHTVAANNSGAGEYFGVSNSRGITSVRIESSFGVYIDIGNISFYLPASAADTQASMQRNVLGLRKIFSLQASYTNPGLSYDCSMFDKNGICVAFSGRHTGTSGGGPEATSGVLTAAYKINPSIRVGGFVEQYASDYSSGGVKVKSNNPDFGIFGVWSQTGTDEGFKVRAAYRYGKRDLTIARDAIATAEAGSGNSKLVTEGAQLTASYGYSLSNTLLASPYFGVRYTNIGRNSYTESTSKVVITPLHFDTLRQETTSLLAGVNLSALVAPSVTVNGSVGVETDTERKVGKYSATGVADLAAIEFNGDTRKTRMVGSMSLAYKIDNTQQISAQAWYREEAYGSTATTTAMITYTAGF